MITALCGGVGGSKLVSGLYATLPPNTLSVVVNTADDLTLWGLHISPDLDTVVYTLAGMAQRELGWGIEGDSFRALEMLNKYGAPSWFRVGDQDLGTDVYRTWQLGAGKTLTEITSRIATALQVSAQVLPMTDHRVATLLEADGVSLDFQEYFVHRRHAVPVTGVRYQGVEHAEATEQVLAAVREAEAVVIVNSNPVLSILPILAVPGIRTSLTSANVPRVAVSPMAGTGSVAGPAGELMALVDQPATSSGVARLYQGLIDGIVIDRQDAAQRAGIEDMGIAVLVTEAIMRDAQDRARLAHETVAFARSLQ